MKWFWWAVINYYRNWFNWKADNEGKLLAVKVNEENNDKTEVLSNNEKF